MKNYKNNIALMLMVVLLASCGQNLPKVSDSNLDSIPSASIDDSQDSTIPSIDDSTITSPSEGTSDSPSDSASELPPATFTAISDVVNVAKALTSPNSVGVAMSSTLYKTKGTLISNLDCGTSKTGYNAQYKMMAIDSSGSIYISCNVTMREKLISSVLNNNVVEFIGYPTLNRGQPELELSSYSITTDSQSDYQISLATSVSLETLYSKINALTPNCKGTAFGNLFKINALCLQKLAASDNNMIFIDNTRSLFVYDNNKLYNSISAGTNYELIGSIQMYQFRPGFVLTKIVSSSATSDISYENYLSNATVEYTSTSSLFTVKPSTDLAGDSYQTYPAYTNLFGKIIKLEGYVNLYNVASSGATLTINEKLNTNEYSSIQTATADKALIFNNTTETGLKTTSDLDNSILYPYYQNDKKISIYLFPYFYNNTCFKVEGHLSDIQEI